MLLGVAVSMCPGTAEAVQVSGFIEYQSTAKSKSASKAKKTFRQKADKKDRKRSAKLHFDRFDNKKLSRSDAKKLSRNDVKKRRRHVKHAVDTGGTAPLQPAIVQPVIIQPSNQLLPAAPATLTGDNVVITERSLLADNSGVGPFVFSGIVGPGPDTNSPAPYTYDLDLGPDGNQFQLASAGTFCAYITASCAPEAFTITFSDLNFTDGAELVDIAGLFSVFPGTTFTVLANSVTFFMTDTRHDAGVLLSGTFVTRTLAPIPLPAAGGFLAFGIAGLSFLSLRRRRIMRASLKTFREDHP